MRPPRSAREPYTGCPGGGSGFAPRQPGAGGQPLAKRLLSPRGHTRSGGIETKTFGMNAFEINKIVGALLMTLLVTLVIGYIGNALVPVAEEDHAAVVPHEVDAEEAAEEAGAPAEPAIEDFPAALAAADAKAGRKVFRQCAACHTATDGGANRVGANLWDIVGQPRAGAAGFGYSRVMAEQGGSWSYDDLNAFLAKPKDYLPGTKMKFVGLKKIEDRANVIAYLRSLSASPVPLP